MGKDIAVLMTTYNGREWLRAQLDSIIAQKDVDFTLYVRDDGSEDSTVDILNEYAARHENIVIVQDCEHRGAAGGFLWLLEKVEADCYFFADQDDVWLPEKMALSVRQLEMIDSSLPAAVHSDLTVVDRDLNELYPSFYGMTRRDAHLGGSLRYVCAYHSVTGCTAALNRKARDLMLGHRNMDCLHDELLGLVIAGNHGILRYIDRSTVLYRQHGDNVLGARPRSFLRKLKDFPARWSKYVKWYKNVHAVANVSVGYFVFNKLYYTVLRTFYIK